jgi:RNA polymerase sigma factor (sigma-70 family)
MKQPEGLGGSAPVTDKTLLVRARNGDMAAFAELTERNRRSALVVAGAMVDSATAEDVVSDSFERLLVTLRNGGGPTESLRPYLLQMVRNRAIDSWRGRREVCVEPAVLTQASETIEDADTEATGVSMVRQAFEQLPERWQTVLWLGEVEGYSYAEIGRELGLREGAVTQLLHRAREGMRQAYLKLHASYATGECGRIRPLLVKYVRGKSGARDCAQVEQHLDNCPECAAAAGKLRQLNRRMGAAIVAAVAGGVALELLRRPGAAMAAELSPTTNLFTSSTIRHLTGAAAGILLGLATFVTPANTADISGASLVSGPVVPAPTTSTTAPTTATPTTAVPTASSSATGTTKTEIRDRSSSTPSTSASTQPSVGQPSVGQPSVGQPSVGVEPIDVAVTAESNSDGVFVSVSAPDGTLVSATVTFSPALDGPVSMDAGWSCVETSTDVTTFSCVGTVTGGSLNMSLLPNYAQAGTVTVWAEPIDATDPDLSNNQASCELVWAA